MPKFHRSEPRLRLRLSEQRREELRTTLWVVPAVEIVAALALFIVTYSLDRAAYRGDLTFPNWVNNGSADAARQILTALAAAVITVVGLVFSILIVALTLASTQFGPRMLRNFLRDRGVQITLGTFVATFFYEVLTLGAVSHGSRGDFVPHLSITVALALTLVDLGVLVFFIDRVAKSIQLPEVIAGIGQDLASGITVEFANGERRAALSAAGNLPALLATDGAEVSATATGYLQFVHYSTIVDIASDADAAIELLYRPGHFVVRGLPLARVWPASAASDVSRGLEKAHVTGAHRTLRQDPAFAIDQLVEIAIRALSPAVNDTFTALDVHRLAERRPVLAHLAVELAPCALRRRRQGARDLGRDELRTVRRPQLRQDPPGGTRYARGDDPATGRAHKVMAYTTTPEQQRKLLDQADMILRSSEESVAEPADRADVRRRYDALVTGEREKLSRLDDKNSA